MRKTILILLISSLLAGCSVIPATKPTLTSEEMATRVALLLTSMPTEPASNAAAQPVQPVVPELPTLVGLDGAMPTLEGMPEMEIGDIATPTTDETALAAFLGVTATPEPLTEMEVPTEEVGGAAETTEATATPPIAMPSETPTPTVPPTETPGGTPLPGIAITATFAASDPRTMLPVPSWTDTMDKGDNWPKGTDAYTAINFVNGFMELIGLSSDGDNGWRLTMNDFDNAYVEATARFGPACQGLDKWGIMLHVPDRSTADEGYWFSITCDGKYAFQKWNANPPDDEKSVTNLLAWTSDPNIRPGANAVNRIGVLAKGSQYTLFINGQMVGQVVDGTYTSGGFGLLVGPRVTKRFTIYVDEMSYWINPPL